MEEWTHPEAFRRKMKPFPVWKRYITAIYEPIHLGLMFWTFFCQKNKTISGLSIIGKLKKISFRGHI